MAVLVEPSQATVVAKYRGPEDHPAWESFRNALTAMARVSVVIPAINEAKNLPHVLRRLPAGLHEVILVDGNSTDGTPEVAREAYPDITILSQAGRGKGNALRTAYRHVTGDIVVTLDADGSMDPDEIPIYVGALLAGADFAKGSRFLQGGGSDDITVFRSIGNTCLMKLVNLLYRTRYTDITFGFNAYWSRNLPIIEVDCDGFEFEIRVNARAAKLGLCVYEVPSFEHRRIHGVSNLNAVRDGMRILRSILTERFKGQPAPDSAIGYRRAWLDRPSASVGLARPD